MKRNLTTVNTIVCDAKLEISSDVNADIDYDILGTEFADIANEEDGVHKIEKGIYTEQYPIKIDELKKIIDKFESIGCNYVSIDYNCDHPDYIFCGVDVHVATEEEIEEENEKERTKLLIQAEQYLKNLEKTREKVIKEITELKK